MKTEKPTREERLKAYEYAREQLNICMDNHAGICALLRRYFVETRTPKYYFDIIDFPELIDQKPKDKDLNVYFFNSAKERIQVLTKIINKMKDEKRIPIELPSDCEAKFDEENNVLIISKKKIKIKHPYIPDSVDEIEDREWFIDFTGEIKTKEANASRYGIQNQSTKERAQSFLNLMQLVEMRDASNGDWRADWKDETQGKWIIECDVDDSICVNFRTVCRDTMAFKSEEIAQAFLKKHRELILTAKELL